MISKFPEKLTDSPRALRVKPARGLVKKDEKRRSGRKLNTD